MDRSRWSEIHTRSDVADHAIRIHDATAPGQPETKPKRCHADEWPEVERMRWALWLAAEAQQLVEATVQEARAQGVPWSTVGEVHGMARQSAQQKFRHLNR